MRKIILGFIATVSISNLSFGQATLEHSYTTNYLSEDSSWETIKKGLLYSFNTQNGINYFTFNNVTNTLEIYNQNHILTNTTIFPETPQKIHFITDKLFNNDNLIEILYTTDYASGNNTKLINENGILLQTISNRPYVRLTKDSSNNFKLIVSNIENYMLKYDVYSLSGTLSIAQQDIYLKNSFVGYPNPTENSINITNKLSNGENGILEVFDTTGKKVMEKNVTGGNNEINLDVTELSSGVYIYKLNGQTNRFIKK